MSEKFTALEIARFIDRKIRVPMMPVFNRLEGRPRTHDFDRALRAEVRDPLWMLTRQWQMGEFKGEDAGSPVTAKLHVEKTRLTRYRASGHPAEPYDHDVPLEAKVEKRRIPFHAGGVELALDIRLLMGRHWLKLLRKAGLEAAYKDEYRRHFAIHQPDPDAREDVYYCASPRSWRQHAASANRHVDGKKLYDDIAADAGAHAVTVGAAGTERDELVALGNRFTRWFDALFQQPADGRGDAWQPDRLEYRFACAAPRGEGEQAYCAEEYYHGHLDWYNFSIDAKRESFAGSEGNGAPPAEAEAPIVRELIPTPVQFNGMPNTRWWAFEEGNTDFGGIEPDTTDLNKLLLMEFGLVYANDWYLLPLTVPSGSICKVGGMSVRNVFGERFWITASGEGVDDDPDRWTLFSMDIAGTETHPADLSLMVVPTVPRIQEGKPAEEVQLARDEVANMVWGIETRVPLPGGPSIPGAEAAGDTLAWLQRIADQSAAAPAGDEPPAAADRRYRIMSRVPENWIPFISTHVPGSNRQTRLQRGSMPRVIEGAPQAGVEKIKPRTSLLREGLDRTPKKSWFINEEEVPRAGINVSLSFQRTRWHGGEVFNWLGIRKRTGRGESASMLQFDYLQPVRKASRP